MTKFDVLWDELKGMKGCRLFDQRMLSDFLTEREYQRTTHEELVQYLTPLVIEYCFQKENLIKKKNKEKDEMKERLLKRNEQGGKQ